MTLPEWLDQNDYLSEFDIMTGILTIARRVGGRVQKLSLSIETVTSMMGVGDDLTDDALDAVMRIIEEGFESAPGPHASIEVGLRKRHDA